MNIGRYFIRKPVSQIQSECEKSELKRSLGALNLISLGIGCIIGAGIFVMTGQAAAQYAGPAIMLSFVLAGLACAFAGLCYAELASTLPVSGSAYTYAYASLGEVFAWIMGWLLLLEYGLAASTVAVGWSGYVVSFLREFGVMFPLEWANPMGMKITVAESVRAFYESHGYTMITEMVNNNPVNYLADQSGALVLGALNLPAIFGIAMVTVLLVIGISESAKVNNIIVIVKLSVVILLIVVGAFYVDTANWHPFIPDNQGGDTYGYQGILKAAGVIFFAYVGFEAVSTAAQEAKNPQRDMPIGILGSLLVCTILYMALSAVLTGIIPYYKLNVPDPMALAVDSIGLKWLSFLIKIGAIAGLSSVMLVLVYGQTRVFYMMSKDGLLPSAFSTLHQKFKTPYINTILIGVCVATAAGIVPLSQLGDLVSMGTLAAFAIVCFSVLYLRHTQPDIPRPFRAPGGPIIPVLGILFCGYLMYGIGWTVFVTLKLYFIGGVIIYLLYGQFASKLAKSQAK
jgi:APA family basic amino acid/polyamine antiporter